MFNRNIQIFKERVDKIPEGLALCAESVTGLLIVKGYKLKVVNPYVSYIS